MSQSILDIVARYYSERIVTHGPTPNGVDWKDDKAQCVRFERLLSVVEPQVACPRLVEFGCGYGALLKYASMERGLNLDYEGVDISQDMIDAARRFHPEGPRVRFTLGVTPGEPGDYCVASGLFNVKLDIDRAEWERHVLSVIVELDRHSVRGFSFNCLTSYSDQEKRSPHLYYGDPCFFFDLCKKQYGFNVALLHDYDMYDFTICVRKQVGDA